MKFWYSVRHRTRIVSLFNVDAKNKVKQKTKLQLVKEFIKRNSSIKNKSQYIKW